MAIDPRLLQMMAEESSLSGAATPNYTGSMNPQVYNPQGFGTTRQGGISPSHEGPGGVGYRGFFPQVQPSMSPNNPFSMIAPPMPSPNYNLGYTPPDTPLPPPVAPVVPTDTTGNAYWDQSGGNEPVNWGEPNIHPQANNGTPPGQYPPERIAQHAEGDSLYNAAFDSSEASYLAQNPAMSPVLANKLFPQNTPNLDQSIGGLMARTNELGSETVPRELPGMGTDTGGMYNAPSTEGNVSYQGDPANLSLPPSTGQGTNADFQQMTNPLGADLSSPPAENQTASQHFPLPPAVLKNEAGQLADQYLADNSASKWENFNTATDADRDFMKGKINPATAGNILTDQTDLQSLVKAPAGGGMSAQDAAAMLAGQTKITTPEQIKASASQKVLPEVATPTTTGTGKAGDSSVITPPVVESSSTTTGQMYKLPDGSKVPLGSEEHKQDLLNMKLGKPRVGTAISTTTSGDGSGTAIGTSTPSGATTGTDASSGGINIAGLYDDASKGKGIAGTSNIDYTSTPAPDPNIDYSKVDPRTGEPDKWTKFGNLMTSPRMRVAMMEAAKALDPTGFGGKIATGMGPIMSGEFENDYMSRILAGEDPGLVGKEYSGILSMDQMSNARDEVIKIAEQRRKQQGTDETEDPAQKLYRQMAGEAYKGGIALSVADKNLWGKMASAINTSGTAENKQIATQSYKSLQDIKDKLPVGLYTTDADGNIQIDQEKWKQFLLSEDKPITPTEIDAFIGALNQLDIMGMPTLGFENSLDSMKKLKASLNPAQLTQIEYKEGDIKEVNGKKLRRDAEGNWRPVV